MGIDGEQVQNAPATRGAGAYLISIRATSHGAMAVRLKNATAVADRLKCMPGPRTQTKIDVNGQLHPMAMCAVGVVQMPAKEIRR